MSRKTWVATETLERYRLCDPVASAKRLVAHAARGTLLTDAYMQGKLRHTGERGSQSFVVRVVT